MKFLLCLVEDGERKLLLRVACPALVEGGRDLDLRVRKVEATAAVGLALVRGRFPWRRATLTLVPPRPSDDELLGLRSEGPRRKGMDCEAKGKVLALALAEPKHPIRKRGRVESNSGQINDHNGTGGKGQTRFERLKDALDEHFEVMH